MVNYNPKTLEKVEQYRQLLLASSTPSQIKKKLNIKNKLAYERLTKAYKDIYHNEEVKQNRLLEILEKMAVVEKKAFNDYLKGAIKPKEYTDVLDFYINKLTKFGLAPEDINKIQLNISGNLDVNTRIKAMSDYLLELEKRKKENKL